MKRGKKYLEKRKTSPNEELELDAAIDQAKKNSISEFTGKIDLHINLAKTQKKDEADTLRVNMSLPNSLGGDSKVVVFAEGSKADEAKKAGAEEAGSEDLIKKVEDGWTDFDVAISTPEMMAKIAKLGRTLGTRGLMPSPKMGTVTEDVASAVEEFKKGKLAIKSDDSRNVHISVGTTEMETEKIAENTEFAIKKVLEQMSYNNPILAFKRVTLAPTMGPSVKVKIG